MKRWIDANKIAEQEIDIKSDRWMYEDLMKQKPNFDKSKEKAKRKNKKKFKYRE